MTTVEELDDIIRYSFGPALGAMGLFQTYRIARRAKPACAISWPSSGPAWMAWTKLTMCRN